MNRRREEQETSLLDRWKQIEKLDNADDDISEEKFIRLKESWFSDAYRFLQGLPQEEHCWCKHNDISWPLLETFYNYFDASETKTLLSALWKRFSCELRICIHCVVQYHNAKEFYKSEFPEDAVKLLLEVLQMLDEERVAEQIKSTLQKVKGNMHGVNGSSEEVVSVLFEVLMFPSLLEDAEINSAITPFLLHVESSHELTLAGDQRYPGVYALLFHSSQDVRGVAHRLAGSAGKLRNAHDMQPIQPLLQKYMHCLEFDMFEDKRLDNTRGAANTKNSKLTEASFLGKSTRARSRPRVGFKKDCLWIGMKTLLGLLEPLAFEDGVVEQYPSFVSIVLNHVSEATSVFWNALHCLKLLLEALGYKLWLKTTFSPGVMRNTLLGQCFHTREEKMHKAIFDLFQPFLQSLEALQDGEHERQCQNLLYFLLQQVPRSSNFSSLMSKMAKQIAFGIILQQYKMDPPSPPVDCVHMWGPALVDAIKDLSLYTPIRQSAILLMQTIIVSDAIALACLSLRSSLDEANNLPEKDDDEDSDMIDVGMTQDSCWLVFKKTEKLVASDCSGWLCCPLLWKEILEAVTPSCMTVSFSQAVFWAISQLSLIPQTAHSMPFDPSLGFGSSNTRELTCAFQWEKPKGCDDVANGRICSNSLKAQAWSLPLARVFRQSAEVYMGRLWDSRALEQWFWEPYIAEPITLLLFDSNEKLRDFNRRILSHFAKDSSLDSGLEFLYTDHLASDFVCRAFRLAIKMLMTSMLAESSHNFQHLFFIMWKVFTAEQKLDADNSSSIKSSDMVKSIEDGGFLKQPEYNIQCSFSNLDISSESKGSLLRKLCEQLLISLWSLLMKAIKEGRQLANDMTHSMTFARMFDLLPIVFSKLLKMKLECMLPSHEGAQSNLQWSSSTWVHELIEWGKVEAVTLHRRWKVASSSILNELAAENAVFDSAIMSETQKKLGGCRLVDDITRTEVESVFSMLLHEKLQQCDVLAESQALRRADCMGNKDIRQMPLRYTLEGKSTSSYMRPDFIDLSDDVEDDVVSITCSKDATLSSSLEAKIFSVVSPHVSDKDRNDFGSKKLEKPGVKPDEVHPSQPLKHRHPISVKRVGSQIPTLDKFFAVKADKRIGDSLSVEHTSSLSQRESHENKELKNLNMLDWGAISVPQSPLLKASEKQAKMGVMGDTSSTEHTYSSSLSQRESHENKELKNLKTLDCGAISVPQSPLAKASEKQVEMRVIKVEEKLEVRQSTEADMVKSDSMLKSTDNDAATDLLLRKLVSDLADDEEDPLEAALDAAASRGPPKSTLKTTPIVVQPKRQLIRLQIPNEQMKNSSMRLNGSRARIVAPRLDEWYKRILALNYFEVVSPDPLNSPEDSSIDPLMRVPFTFQSSEHYVEVFRPLVLEEFKAQLQHTHEELLSSTGTVKGILKLMSLERVDDFQVCRFTSEAGEDGVARTCFENDLLLFSRQPFPNTSRSTHFIGKVERRDRDNKSRSIVLVLKLFLHSGVGRLSKARRLLIDRSKWHVIKLMSITPQLREFQALSSTGNIPFFPIIMNPGRSSMAPGKGLSQTGIEGLKALPEKLLKQLKMVYNENQQKAISTALEKDLSLVQGPPGTGKTRTIAAILSVLLATSKSSCSNYHMTRKIASAQNVSSSVGVKKPVSRSAAIARSWQDAALARQMMNEAMVASASEPATGANSKRGRVLVCAQSNAAVDELVSRICKDGLYDSNGCFFKPFLVRVGNVKMVHSDSLPVFIDTLVDERMNYNKQNEGNKKDEDCMRTHVDLLRADLERVMESIKEHEAQRFRCSGNAEDEGRNDVADDEEESSFKLEERKKAAKIAAEGERALNVKLNMLYKRRRQLCADLAMAEQEERKSTEESRVKRQLVKKEIIKEAEVVVTTLSGCGGDVYSVCMEAYNDKKASGSFSDCFFDAVVIDEAAQALEPATLIPLQLLKLSNAKCVMVGDPKQLPATVLSQLASRFSYECSMFERLQRAGHPVTLLSMQYRMHPNIRQFPSAHFYDNMLVDGDGLTVESRTASFHRDWFFGPYIFFDVVEGYEKTSSNSVSQSLSNEAEVDAAFEIFKTLQKSYPNENISGRVGIITPYKKQLSLLRDRFIRSLGPSVGEEIEFNTIDGFQGREVDILILSTVRAVSGNQATASYNRIGFVADVRRMNVALTRARFSLWIVGNAATLQTSPPWAALLSNARDRGLICTLKKPYRDMFSSSHLSQPLHPVRPKGIVDNRKAMEANRWGESRQVLQENNRAEEYLRFSSTGQGSSGHSTGVKTATTAKSVDALAHNIEESSKLKTAAKDMVQREATSECHKTSNMKQKRSVRFIDQPSSGMEGSKTTRNAGSGSSNLVNAPRSMLRQKGSTIRQEKNEDNPKADTSCKTNEILTDTNNPEAADINGIGRGKPLKRSRAVDPKRLTDCDNRKSMEGIPRVASVTVDGTTIISSSRCRTPTEVKLSSKPRLTNDNDGAIGASQSTLSNDSSGMDGGRVDTKKQHRKNEYGGVRNDHNSGLPLSMNEDSTVMSNVCNSKNSSSAGVSPQQGDKQEWKHVSPSVASVDSTIVSKSDNVSLNTDLQSNNINSISTLEMGTKPANELGYRTVVAERQVVSLTEDELRRNRKRRREQVEAMMPAGMFLPSRKPDASLGKAKLANDNRNPKQQPSAYSGKKKPAKTTVLLEKGAISDKGRPNPSSLHGRHPSCSAASQPKVMASESKNNIGGKNLDNEWHLFEMALARSKSDNVPSYTMQTTSKEKGLNRSSENTSVDNILSGMANVSRAQVQGRKEEPSYASKTKSTVPKTKS